MVSKISPENPTLKMSIQVRLNGLSFCILNSQGHHLIWYKKIDFQKEITPVKILEQIDFLYKTESQLQGSFEEVILLFSNELYSIVPKEYFLEEEASNYLKFSTKILKTDVISHDFIYNETLVNVYIPLTNITNYFFDLYGEFEYKHSVSIIIQYALSFPSSKVPHVYLNNFSGYYDLVVVKDGALLFSNTFTYETKEDFIYYLLFTIEQLQLNPAEINLILMGDILRESPLYEIAYTYIKNIEFLEHKFKIQSKESNNAALQREAFILLKSLECE